MNRERIRGQWRQLLGRFRMRWGRLRNERLEVIEGRRELLLGKLQAAYGVTRDEADRQVTAWEDAGSTGENRTAAGDGGRSRTG